MRKLTDISKVLEGKLPKKNNNPIKPLIERKVGNTKGQLYLNQAPKYLDTIGKKEWKRVLKVLKENNLYVDLDEVALSGYCSAYSQWIEAQNFLNENGLTTTTKNGYIVAYPQVIIARESLKLIKAFCQEFGMTPNSRQKMALPEMDDDDSGFDL